MTHLNDEQFEQALVDAAEFRAHLDACPPCRGHLDDLRAVRGRLQQAFAAVHAPEALAQRLAQAASSAGEHAGASTLQHGTRSETVFMRSGRLRRFWPALAAAMVLIAAAPVAYMLTSPKAAQAAQQELVDIHLNNLADRHMFYSEDEPAKLAAYFKDKLGFAPAMPRLNQGMAIRGCCVAHFRGKISGSYVVQTPHGVVSIIVVSDTPAALGLRDAPAVAGRPAWSGHNGMCNLAAIRLGDLTYTAVGEIEPDRLLELLGLLLAQTP